MGWQYTKPAIQRTSPEVKQGLKNGSIVYEGTVLITNDGKRHQGAVSQLLFDNALLEKKKNTPIKVE